MLWRSTSPARRPPGFIEPCLPTPADTVPPKQHIPASMKRSLGSSSHFGYATHAFQQTNIAPLAMRIVSGLYGKVTPFRQARVGK
jgi:hypothetical protein